MDKANVLSSPTCEACGYVVPNPAPRGAACPECHAPIGLGPSPADTAALVARVAELEAELRAARGEGG